MPIGQRVVQASHDAHSQIARDSSTSPSRPNCTMRITWLGARSMSGAMGQPLVHLWHWKQAPAGVPLRRQTSCRKSVVFKGVVSNGRFPVFSFQCKVFSLPSP